MIRNRIEILAATQGFRIRPEKRSPFPSPKRQLAVRAVLAALFMIPTVAKWAAYEFAAPDLPYKQPMLVDDQRSTRICCRQSCNSL